MHHKPLPNPHNFCGMMDNDNTNTAAMNRLPPWWKDVVEWICTSSSRDAHVCPHLAFEDRTLRITRDMDKDAVIFCIPRDRILGATDDVQLALLLSTTTSPYMRTLPTESNLPHQWTQLQQLLGGTTLLRRVRQQQADLAQYAHRQTFLTMFSMVTSRAFVLEHDEIGCVPLLDLCNHQRDGLQNLNYSYQDGKMQVKARRALRANEPLILTYGAKGNHVLLFNYGFCIPPEDNIEPDGSSNDVLEWNGANLRTGDKSYSYGPFARCVEYYMESGASGGGGGSAKEADDMEAFLNECDEDEEGGGMYGNDEDDDDDMLYFDAGTKQQHQDDGDGDGATMVEDELKALEAWESAIAASLPKYSMPVDKIEKQMEKKDGSAEYFACLLQLSERRILYFYRRCIAKAQQRLKRMSKVTKTNDPVVNVLSVGDVERLEGQSEDLVQAYMKIRHGSID